jgi:hypothetical protein
VLLHVPNSAAFKKDRGRAEARPSELSFWHRLYRRLDYQNNMRCCGVALLLFLFGAGSAFNAEPGDDVVSNIARLPVESTALASVGYSKAQRILEVEFRKEGLVYRYLDVPENVFRELLQAPSKAGYYNDNIRGHYQSIHVVKPRADTAAQ